MGAPIERVDGKRKVTGRAVFGFDFELPRMLHGKIKRSDEPHARILAIDTSRARLVPGVRCIITGNDIRGRGLRGEYLVDTPTLAKDRVRYVGEPVAAVAADTLEAAEEAVDLIDVDFERMPAVFDVEESMAPDAPLLHPDFLSYEGRAAQRELPRIPNVNFYHRIVHGDVEKGFSEADIVVENNYKTAMVQHGHIEPNVCVCDFREENGTLDVYASTQAPFRIRAELSRALGLAEHKIRVIGKYTGGGFGNKMAVNAEAICSELSIRTRRPVRIALRREEVFSSTTVRHPHKIYVKDGVSRDGRLVSRYVRTILNGGAYSGGPGIVTGLSAGFALTGTYRVENLKFESLRVATNLPPGGAFRGFGTSQIDFAIEQQMDILAQELKMDPVEFRLRNVLKNGESNALGETIRGADHEKVLTTCASAIGWKGSPQKRREGPWVRGVGFALTDKYSQAPMGSSAMVRLRDDATIEVYVGAPEIGTGSHTVLSQIVAQEFQVPVSKVELVAPSDTELVPFDEGAFSSRTTMSLGNSLLIACGRLKERICTNAARRLGVRPNELDVKGGYVINREDGSRTIKLEDLFARGKLRSGVFLEDDGALVGAGSWYYSGGDLDRATGRIVDSGGRFISERAVTCYSPNAAGVELAVNTETGQVKVLRVAVASDVGKAINPRNVKNQIRGCVSMAMNIALYEEMVWLNGRLVNPDFKDYKLVTTGDLPEIMPIIIEVPFDAGPYGAKGAGEGALTCTIPAIANAIHDATGVRLFETPMKAETILEKLEADSGGIGPGPLGEVTG